MYYRIYALNGSNQVLLWDGNATELGELLTRARYLQKVGGILCKDWCYSWWENEHRADAWGDRLTQHAWAWIVNPIEDQPKKTKRQPLPTLVPEVWANKESFNSTVAWEATKALSSGG